MVAFKLFLVLLMVSGPLAYFKFTSLAFHKAMAGQWGTAFALNTVGLILFFVLPLIAYLQNEKLKKR